MLIVVLQNSNRIVHVKSCFDRNDVTVPGLKINMNACEIAVKMAWNFHFRAKNALKWIRLESRQRNKEKGSPIKLHI